MSAESVGDDSGVGLLEPGRVLGAYELRFKIGEGGMSVVYLATRADDQYRKRVAIKLVPLAMASAEHRRRFRIERQILAGLDHPNIARLFDAGTTEEGLPYFVMEYIEGERIDAYCDRHRLSVGERLKLFRTVCSAVHYAHQNLVVHRDLKPSNILVTEDGVPKLLDFGIAKLLNPELMSPGPPPTLTWHRVLTPDYASPEQVQGKAITTASDVYSLGVLLYKLLTGRLPLVLENKSPVEIERALTEEEPEKPSAAVSPAGSGRPDPALAAVGHDRDVRLSELRRLLARDLDNIVLMALRKEPQRRYSSAQQLSEDLRRQMQSLPVSARGDALSYRLGKLARRYWIAVATAALVALLVVSFAAVAAIQSARVARERDQARLERDKSKQALSFIEGIFRVADPGQSGGRDLSASQIVERGAEQVLGGLQEQPEVRASIMVSLGNIHRNLGLYDRAGELLRQALEVRESTLGPEHPDIAESANDLSLLLMDRGDSGAAQPLLERALEIRRQAFGEEHPEVAETVNNLGMAHQNQGDYEVAEGYLERGLELNRRVFGEEHTNVALSLNNLGTLRAQQGDARAAEAAFREALEIQRRLHATPHPEVARTLGNLGFVLRARGDLEAAEEVLRESLTMQRSLVGEVHLDVAVALNNLGMVLVGKGEHAAAEVELRRALELWLELFGKDNPRTGVGMDSLAQALAGLGAVVEAETLYRDALAVFRQTLPAVHPYVARPLTGLGRLRLETGDPRTALPLLREALEIQRQALPAGHPEITALETLVDECQARLTAAER